MNARITGVVTDMRVLLIGIEPETAETLSLSLRLRWPDVNLLVATDAENGLSMLEQESPDMILLESGYSGASLSRVIQEIRSFSDVSLVVLAEKGDETEEIMALELGADEYVRSPFRVGGLLARLVAVYRRSQGIGFPKMIHEPPLQYGAILINPATNEAFLDSRPLVLTATEFRVLYLLVGNKGGVVTHRMIAQPIWGDRFDSGPLVRKYIQRLRQKLGDDSQTPQLIANIKGIGYRFIGSLIPVESAERPLVTSNGHHYAPVKLNSILGYQGPDSKESAWFTKAGSPAFDIHCSLEFPRVTVRSR